MTQRPILFTGPMVRAILDGRKTMTRRVVDRDLWDYLEDGLPSEKQIIETDKTPMGGVPFVRFCPYGAPGARLWVREAWNAGTHAVDGKCGFVPFNSIPQANKDGCVILYAATDANDWIPPMKWHPSIHMPRWASRLALTVVSVHVERVNSITAGDAEAEGVDASTCCRIEAFATLWDSINAARGYAWSVNPWVWVVQFNVSEVQTT